MRLKENNQKLSSICRDVESRTLTITDLSKLEIEIELVDNFRSLSPLKSIQNSPALFRISTGKILVNNEVFFNRGPIEQFATAMHEIAHAFLNNQGESKSLSIGEEDVEADLLVCKWGFYNELKSERETSYGKEYIDHLSKWQNQEEARKCLNKWQMRRLAGIGK